jgi:alcohol dehydrogenase class IV
MNEFRVGTAFYLGDDALTILETIEIARVLLICDPFIESSGMLAPIIERLDKRGIAYCVFSDIIPDPTIEVVASGVERIMESQPDCVIAIGGGSAIDGAKAIIQVYVKANQGAKPLFITIPTTSGTGSEVTSFAVITDGKTQTKYPIVDDEMLPDIAILDTFFTKTVPPKVTADSGMDVLTHDLEAYVSIQATDFSDACAEKSLKLVWDNLVQTYRNGDDLLAREKMHHASSLAGIAFNNASLGICHSLSHALGGRFHLPHGRINAMLLPHIISFNADLDGQGEQLTIQRYAACAKIMGLGHDDGKASVFSLIRGIKTMMNRMAMPESIEAFGIDPQEFIDAIPEMAKHALADNCTRTNPRPVTVEALATIYRKLVHTLR